MKKTFNFGTLNTNTQILVENSASGQAYVITSLRFIKLREDVTPKLDLFICEKGKSVRLVPINFILDEDTFMVEIVESDSPIVLHKGMYLKASSNFDNVIDFVVTGDLSEDL